MTTVAGMDRPIHHAVILEVTGTSVCAEKARTKGGNDDNDTYQTTTTPVAQSGNDADGEM